VKRNDRFSETEILREVEKRLSERLPAGWAAQLSAPVAARTADGYLTLRGPDGERAEWAIEAKSTIYPKDIPGVIQQVMAYQPGRASALMVAAPFIGRSTREALATAGLSYCDTTGNLRLIASKPAVWLEGSGAKENPWKEEAPLSTLRGRSAGRVVRALCDSRPPFKIRELASRAGASPATTSRVAELLEREALIRRDDSGTILEVSWPELIARWTRDYDVMKSNIVRNFLDPRGLSQLASKLKQYRGKVAVTGSFAIPADARVAPPRLAIVYVEGASDAAMALNLTAVESGANVLLVEPDTTAVFEGIRERDGLPCAALSQVAADLLTSPGRAPAEGEALLGWMKENEDAWRV